MNSLADVFQTRPFCHTPSHNYICEERRTERFSKGFRCVDLSVAEPAKLGGVLDDLHCVRARLDFVEVAVAARLKATSATPERGVAKGAQRAGHHGSRVLNRAAVRHKTPLLRDALETGALSGEHVYVYAKVLGSLDGPVKSGLTEAAPGMIEAAGASGSTSDDFATSLHAAAEQIAADGGMARLECQRRAARLRTWTNKATGVWHLSGSFDPESGVVLHGRLEAAMAAMFAVKTPPTTPSDPGEKQDHLCALALLAITGGAAHKVGKGASKESGQIDEWNAFAKPPCGGNGFGRFEVSIVIDTMNLDENGKPTVDWGIPVNIPWSRMVRYLSQGNCAAGHRSQRGGVRCRWRVEPWSIYPSCQPDATMRPPGDLRHVRSAGLRRFVHPHQTASHPLVAKWWTYRLRQPPPVVWQAPPPRPRRWLVISLGPNRELTITQPDGQVMRTGPPSRKAAA